MAKGVEQYRLRTMDQLEFSERVADPTDGEQGRAYQKVADIVDTDRLEEEIKASPFQSVNYLALMSYRMVTRLMTTFH